jgi:hypothetical protein
MPGTLRVLNLVEEFIVITHIFQIFQASLYQILGRESPARK